MHNYNLDDMVEILRKSAGGETNIGYVELEELMCCFVLQKKSSCKKLLTNNKKNVKIYYDYVKMPCVLMCKM